MSVELPARPQKGQKIPHDYFQRMWDHQKSLELHGDLKTTTVKRDRSGTTVHAHTRGGSTTNRTSAIIAQIDVDNGDGTYDATEQKNAAGTFSDRAASTGLVFDSGTNGNLYELNGIEGVPVGTYVVVHRVENTSGGPIWYFDSGYDGRSFWAKITGETSGAYSWTELEGDATTTTARTGTTNASEVSGRLGIPTNSIVRMFPHPNDNADYQFEYHGANQGTEKALSYADSATAYTDSWNREDQSSNRGENDQFVSRLYVDSSTGELKEFTRRPSYDANGHRETVSTESRRTLGVFEPSTETYEFVDCATGLTTVARFGVADLPTDDYCWVHDGANFVKSYNDGISAGAATSPAPCVIYMPTSPVNCSGVNFSAFDDTFAGSSLEACNWDDGSSGGGSVTVTGGAAELVCPDSGSSSVARIITFCPLSGDFSVVLTYLNLSITYNNTGVQATSSFGVLEFETTIGGTAYAIVIGSSFATLDGQNQGTWTRDGATYTHYDSGTPTSGTLTISRSGTTLTLKRDATTIDTITVGTGPPSFSTGSLAITLNCTQQIGDGDATLDCSLIEFTGG